MQIHVHHLNNCFLKIFLGYLTITPHYGPMLGGQYVVINGPCIEENATISFSIKGLSSKRCERKSEFSMVCITPMITYVGDALFMISLQDSTKPFIGRYTLCKHLSYLLLLYCILNHKTSTLLGFIILKKNITLSGLAVYISV